MIEAIDGLTGWRHLDLAEVASTNAEAFTAANDGDRGQLWITARSQRAGRARRGREWVSKPGNLYASLLLIEPGPSHALATLPLTVSLALHKALVECCPDLANRLKIKWPNDVLLDNKKLSGILLEAQQDGFGRLAVVIGIGVNCAHFPDNPLYPATSLAEQGVELRPQSLFQSLSDAMARDLRIWAQGHGFSIQRNEWLDRCYGRGKPITARFPDRELTGTFVDIDADGLLLLLDGRGHTHKVSAADIFFGDSGPKGA